MKASGSAIAVGGHPASKKRAWVKVKHVCHCTARLLPSVVQVQAGLQFEVL